jgi:predicted DsbA family dithiol-disulfide isomerase
VTAHFDRHLPGVLEALQRGEGLVQIRRDLAQAAELGITGTPTFLIGRIEPDGSVRVLSRLGGAQSVGAFESALDRAMTSVAAGEPRR